MEFCKQFNAKSKDMEQGAPIPVKITVFSDRSFAFEMRIPPASHLLKKAAKISDGSKEPGRTSAGTITMAQVREVAKKMKDLNTDDLDAAVKTIAGSARSMGLQVWGRMAKIGKRLKAAREGLDREKFYPIDEAVKVVKSRAKAKFDETVEVAMNLGGDPKHADQMVRGCVSCPTDRAAPCGWRCSRGERSRRKPRRRVPMWSGPKTLSNKCRRAISTLIAASPLRT